MSYSPRSRLCEFGVAKMTGCCSFLKTWALVVVTGESIVLQGMRMLRNAIGEASNARSTRLLSSLNNDKYCVVVYEDIAHYSLV